MYDGRKIRNGGIMVAYENYQEFWHYDNCLYTYRTDLDLWWYWCADSRLKKHLSTLYRICKYKFFTENPDITVVNHEFFSQYSNA